MNPRELLRHHVSGAIERGESQAIIASEPDRDTCDAMIALCDRKSRDKQDLWHRLAGSVRKARTML